MRESLATCLTHFDGIKGTIINALILFFSNTYTEGEVEDEDKEGEDKTKKRKKEEAIKTSCIVFGAVFY